MTYFESPGVKLFNDDLLNVLPTFEEKTIDMIFADPPYFLSNGGTTCKSGKRASVNKAKWDKSNGLYKDHAFNRLWISKCRNVMKDDATIWICGTHHNIYSVGFALQELGFKILNHIVFQKNNPPPNLSCRYFTHSSEDIIWAAKSHDSKYCFNYDEMKKQNGGKQMKSVWPFNTPGKKEKKFGNYPTQKPEALLERIILSSTNEGDLVLDPFNGSGTTGVMAKSLGRNYVGIDNNYKGLDITINRLQVIDEK